MILPERLFQSARMIKQQSDCLSSLLLLTAINIGVGWRVSSGYAGLSWLLFLLIYIVVLICIPISSASSAAAAILAAFNARRMCTQCGRLRITSCQPLSCWAARLPELAGNNRRKKLIQRHAQSPLRFIQKTLVLLKYLTHQHCPWRLSRSLCSNESSWHGPFLPSLC